MKAISLYEPWTTLIAIGEKRFETRSWKTDYRGPLLICASLKKPPLHEIIGIMYRAKLTVSDLNIGRAVCVVDLTEILRTDYLHVHSVEKLYGDFSPGRYAWKLENIRRFKNPPPIRGRQGLFDVDDSYLDLETI